MKVLSRASTYWSRADFNDPQRPLRFSQRFIEAALQLIQRVICAVGALLTSCREKKKAPNFSLTTDLVCTAGAPAQTLTCSLVSKIDEPLGAKLSTVYKPLAPPLNATFGEASWSADETETSSGETSSSSDETHSLFSEPQSPLSPALTSPNGETPQTIEPLLTEIASCQALFSPKTPPPSPKKGSLVTRSRGQGFTTPPRRILSPPSSPALTPEKLHCSRTLPAEKRRRIEASVRRLFQKGSSPTFLKKECEDRPKQFVFNGWDELLEWNSNI